MCAPRERAERSPETTTLRPSTRARPMTLFDGVRWTSSPFGPRSMACPASAASPPSNWQATGCRRLSLTLLGGGAFGNRGDWIVDAIERAAGLFAEIPLEVAIVSYGSSKPIVQQLLRRIAG